MLVINSASSAQVRYWSSQAVGSWWLGEGASSLGLYGAIGAGAGQDALASLLEGRRPGPGDVGEHLTSRPGARRRQGWDLVFAAPKSVSVLVAALPPDAAHLLVGPFREAVRDAMSLFAERAAFARSGGAEVRVEAVVGAAFDHRENAAGAPHLHSHVALPNLGRLPGGGWGCLVGARLWEWRDALDACFNLSLRSGLRRSELDFEWRLLPGGAADIVDEALPRSSAAQGRALQVRAAALRSGSNRSGASRVAQVSTRAVRTGTDVADRAHERIAPHEARACLERARRPPLTPLPPPDRQVLQSLLEERSSSVSEPDVWVALASSCPAGLSAKAGAGLAREWGAHVERGPGTGCESDLRAIDLAAKVARERFVHVPRAIVRVELDELDVPAREREAAEKLVLGNGAVAVVGPGPWLCQAAVLDAARAAWQAAGAGVGVLSPSPERWRPLTSLRPAGEDGSVSPGSVLVVDAADHLGPGPLSRLVRAAVEGRSKLVLVAGGTQRWLPAPRAEAFGRLLEGSGVPAPDPGAAVGAGAARQRHCTVEVPGIAVHGTLAGSHAMVHLVDDHLGSGALMVAFGPEEARALNRLAAVAHRNAHGATLDEQGSPAFIAGDRVVALRRLGTVPGASWGEVLEAGTQGLRVRWGPGPGRAARVTEVAGKEMTRLGLGYAVTVPYLRSCPPDQRLLVLGDPYLLGRRYAEVLGAWTALAGPGHPAVGQAGMLVRRRAGAREIATGWPDEQMLERAGPRPLSPSAAVRWADEVTGDALDRSHGVATPPALQRTVPRSVGHRSASQGRSGPAHLGPRP